MRVAIRTPQLSTDPVHCQQYPFNRAGDHTHRLCKKQTPEEMADAVRACRDRNLHRYHLYIQRIIHGAYSSDTELGVLMAEADATEEIWQRADDALDALREAQCD